MRSGCHRRGSVRFLGDLPSRAVMPGLPSLYEWLFSGIFTEKRGERSVFPRPFSDRKAGKSGHRSGIQPGSRRIGFIRAGPAAPNGRFKKSHCHRCGRQGFIQPPSNSLSRLYAHARLARLLNMPMADFCLALRLHTSPDGGVGVTTLSDSRHRQTFRTTFLFHPCGAAGTG